MDAPAVCHGDALAGGEPDAANVAVSEPDSAEEAVSTPVPAVEAGADTTEDDSAEVDAVCDADIEPIADADGTTGGVEEILNDEILVDTDAAGDALADADKDCVDEAVATKD